MRAVAALLATVAVAGCVADRSGPVEVVPVAAVEPPQPRPPAAPPVRLRLEGTATQGGVLLGTVPAGTRALTLDDVAVPVAADGHFLIAFDRDAASTAQLAATLRDGRVISETLTVAPRAWRIERLDSLPRVSQPSAEFARRRPAELAQIAAARRIDGAADGWLQRFVWPATGRISGLFGAQRVYRGEPGSYHSGVDVAVPTGTPVVAPADGVVILAANSPFTLEGNLLMIDHGHGLNSAFLHLSRIDVTVGQRVHQGQPIGAVGATGRATGPHLHWGMKWNEARIDPLLVAGEMNR
jgi:murein DD-endopeptidase MepM/ murein hydrolase activator NlpD